MSEEQMVVTSTIGLLAVGLGLLATRRVREGAFNRRGVFIAIFTGVLASAGNYFLLKAIASGAQASVVFPLTGTYPLVTLVLALLILKERINKVQAAGLLLSLIAIALFSGISQNSALALQESPRAWLILALIALVFFGGTGITHKLSMRDISPETGTVFFAVGFLPIAVVTVVAEARFTWAISTRDWMVGLAWGALSGIAIIAQLAANRTGKASIVTPVTALYPAVTVILAGVLYREGFDIKKTMAIILALMAGVLMARESSETPPAS